VDEKSTEVHKMGKFKKWLIIVVIVLVVIAAGILAALIAAEKHTGTPEFCGTQCHIMKPNYDAWKKDKHSKPDKVTGKITICIDCHYKPGERPTTKAKFKGLGQLFSYLSTGEKEVWKRAAVSDQSCSVANCHPLDKHEKKPLEYIKKYHTEYKGKLKPFTHKTHFDKTIDGQKLHCTSCHYHISPEKHFNVPMDICFLCHFRKAKENEGRAKCSVCHEIPEKPLQVKKTAAEGGDDKPKKPITHKSLEDAKVACNRCHLEMVMGSTKIRMEYCSECHHYPSPELLAKGKNKVLMHQEHVTKHTARCFQCHETISHKKSSYLDAAVKDCAACHPEPHFYTKKLLAGDSGMKVDVKYPSLMHSFGTTCTGCHQKDSRDAKGNKVRKGSDTACTLCHNNDPKYGKMIKQWGQDIKDALAEAKIVEQKAMDAVEQAKGNIPAKTQAKFNLAQENLRTAAAGGGIHNKKYAMLLIDMAQQGFEEVVAEIKGNTPKGGKDEN
jgi:cytochrome c553